MKKPIYMTGGQLSVAFQQVGWTPDQFCAVTNVARRRVMAWIHDGDDIPMWVPVFMAAMTVTEAKSLAQRAQQFILQSVNDQAKSGAA